MHVFDCLLDETGIGMLPVRSHELIRATELPVLTEWPSITSRLPGSDDASSACCNQRRARRWTRIVSDALVADLCSA